jgi:hypothetical protein
MFQRRISGPGGLAVDCRDYGTSDNRKIWVLKNLDYFSLRSKVQKYEPVTAQDALDTSAGLDYYMGQGLYGGMVWAKLSPKVWTVIYSLNTKFYLMKVDMSSEEPLEKRQLPDMFGSCPNIFVNGNIYMLAYTHVSHNYAYLTKTIDWVNFSTPRPAGLYKALYWDTFTLINNPIITLRRFYQINALVYKLGADPIHFDP